MAAFRSGSMVSCDVIVPSKSKMKTGGVGDENGGGLTDDMVRLRWFLGM